MGTLYRGFSAERAEQADGDDRCEGDEETEAPPPVQRERGRGAARHRLGRGQGTRRPPGFGQRSEAVLETEGDPEQPEDVEVGESEDQRLGRADLLRLAAPAPPKDDHASPSARERLERRAVRWRAGRPSRVKSLAR